ncbi:Ankyrin repeat-containing protein BDA1 [Glycine max]|nr:Ankyrin repeat-containing protein BDA1 [Glycine max]
MRELYEASLNGCVSTLDTLIKKDPPILSRVSLYPFTETPLHIASLLGHLEFCQILLQNSPNLATELDSKGRCSLHLASAKGHTEIVKALLRTKPEMSLVRDKDAMLPFHFAAIRGRVGAIKELIEEKPNSIQEMIESDDGSVLHLCVRYNHLQALNLLVESLRGEHQFLSAKYKEDSTILLSAVKHRQIKVESPQKKFRHCGCGLCLATGFSDIRFLQFFASLCVMLVLMSGFPLENKVVMWILAVLMIVAASCMLFTYIFTSNIAAMEILEDPKLQDAAMRELYEASMNGSSLLGYLEFCQVLLDKNPSLATELHSEGRCPFHLASAKGHTEVVKRF